ncbi:MAG: hypothetical protein ABI562_01540 [Chloroflexota bacterium]
MTHGPILVVSADERWLRALEVTIRLGGAETISRRSVGDAVRSNAVEGTEPSAIVVDIGAQTTTDEMDEVVVLVQVHSTHAVVIVPESLASDRGRFESVGATVLVRPYRPSELFAALWPGDPAKVPSVEDESLGLDEDPHEVPAAPQDGAAIDVPTSDLNGG